MQIKEILIPPHPHPEQQNMTNKENNKLWKGCKEKDNMLRCWWTC